MAQPSSEQTSRNPYAVIFKYPGARRFSISGAVARFPMSMVGIGILLMVQVVYDSYALGGQVSAVYIIAQAIVSPQLAKLVDRRGQAKIMLPTIVTSAAALTGLIVATVTHSPIWVLFALAALTGATIGSIGAMVRSRWTHIIQDPKQLHTAYSLESAVDELIFVIGPIAATLLATSVASYAGLIVPIVLMLVGGFWFLSQRETEPPIIDHSQLAPVKPILTNPAVLCIIAVFICVGSVFGATDVSTIAFAEDQGNKAISGAILGVFALGSGISGLGYGARQWASPLWQRFVIGILGLAVGVTLFFFATNLWMLAGAMFITGFAISPTLINGNNMIQLVVPPRQLTEGLTWVGTALGAGVSIGSALAGQRIDAQDGHAGFLIVTIAAGICVVVALVSIPVLRSRTATSQHQISEVDVSGDPELG